MHLFNYYIHLCSMHLLHRKQFSLYETIAIYIVKFTKRGVLSKKCFSLISRYKFYLQFHANFSHILNTFICFIQNISFVLILVFFRQIILSYEVTYWNSINSITNIQQSLITSTYILIVHQNKLKSVFFPKNVVKVVT